MSQDTPSILDHFSREDRVGEYYGAPDPLNETRRGLVRREVLARLRTGSHVLEVGCGIGTLTSELISAGMVCEAIDLSPEMVKHARSALGGAAVISEVDLFDYRPPGKFAATIANGVACYYRDKIGFLRRLAELTQPGGFVAVTHRNNLFNLFALNNGTIEFIAHDLLSSFAAAAQEQIASGLASITGLGEPRRRSSSDELYRSSENPLTVAELYRAAGLTLQEVRYCFMHPFPPRLKPVDGTPSVEELQRQFEDRWEGMFLGSQFLAVATVD